MDYEYALSAFQKYLKNFDMKDRNIKIKYYHSIIVINIIEKLAFSLGCTLEEIKLAKIIALLHDIGRFKQIEIAKEINDYKTKIDHAKLGVDYLFLEGHIRDFVKTDINDEIIKEAIFYHNKLNIPDIDDDKSLKFIKMIRDADKIDILRVEAIYYRRELKEKDISKKILKCFYDQQLIDHKDIKTNSEETLSYLAYLFDINFSKSFGIINDTDNLNLFIVSLSIKKDNENFAKEIINNIQSYIKERLGENDK